VLEQEPLVLLNLAFALRRLVDLYCLEHGITPRIAIETTSLSVIVEAVRLGRLLTVLSRSIACSQAGLHPLMLLPKLPHHTITLICRKGAYQSPASRAFAALASEWSAHQCQAAPGERLRPCPMADVGDPDKHE
jgi:LysR family cyn operon transcriptional activator